MKHKSLVPIEYTAFLVQKECDEHYFIAHIFNALRANPEVCLAPDYQRLYDEALDFLFRRAVVRIGWKEKKLEWGYDWLEFLSDLQNKDGDRYPMETVDAFLAERRRAWEDWEEVRSKK